MAPEDRLHGVGEDGALGAAAAAGFAFREDQMLTEADGAGDARAGFAAHEPIVAARQFALAGRRKLLAQRLGDDEAQARGRR